MRVLLTNDDGVDAPGIEALYRAVADVHETFVVAPDGERSSYSHAATLGRSFSVEEREHSVMGKVFAVGGTPVDCVRMAVAELVRKPIDCVLSGINRGANASIIDVAQSGTVAAAREGAFCGLRSIAISQMFRTGLASDWPAATRWTRNLLEQLLTMDAPEGAFWNVNLPAMESGREPDGVRIVPMSRDHVPLAFARDDDGQSGTTGRYRFSGDYEGRPLTPDTDLAVAFSGSVAVTAVGIDPTHVLSLPADFRLVL